MGRGRILALGDVHGCLVALDAVLAACAFGPEDTLVALGDYVDRGIDSAGVIDRLIELHRSGNVVSLRGNHEEMMMLAREGRENLDFWLNCGGDSALSSYAARAQLFEEGRLTDVPVAHWNFLDQQCTDWFETGSYFFVHAGVTPEVPLAGQTLVDLRWRTFDNPLPHQSGKIMICGHTPQKSGVPTDLGHAICIDTGVCTGGWLTCMDLIGKSIWQANERGKVRRLG